MLVGRGALSFRCYAVSGKSAQPSDDKILEKLDAFAFTGLGAGEEGSVVGWVGPEHLFDGSFTADKVMRDPYAVFALRVDTRKVPGPLLAAHTAVEIAATLEAEGVDTISGARKREIKQEVKRRLLAETPPSQRAYGVFWNVKGKRICLQTTSKTTNEHFRGFFERAFDLSLEPALPGLAAAAFAKEQGTLEALQEARPLSLAVGNNKKRATASVA
jgi:hypothetical protein